MSGKWKTTFCKRSLTRKRAILIWDIKEELMKQERAEKANTRKVQMERVDEQLCPELKTQVTQARDKGASSWLNALPIAELDFQMNKEEFHGALRIRYNQQLPNLPAKCPCGSSFTVSHALTCKKGGFIHERHDNR